MLQKLKARFQIKFPFCQTFFYCPQILFILSQLYFNSSSEMSENFLKNVKSTTVIVSVFVEGIFVGNLTTQIGSISCQATGTFS